MESSNGDAERGFGRSLGIRGSRQWSTAETTRLNELTRVPSPANTIPSKPIELPALDTRPQSSTLSNQNGSWAPRVGDWISSFSPISGMPTASYQPLQDKQIRPASLPPTIPYQADDNDDSDDDDSIEKHNEPPQSEGYPREAYCMIISAFFALMASFGWISSAGVWQAFYQEYMLQNEQPTTIAWIASTGFFLMYFGAILVSVICEKYGFFWVILVGTTLHVGGLVAASFATDFNSLLVTQGIISPIGCCCLFFGSVRAATLWFETRMALVIGISAGGASLGGVIFPLMVNNLLSSIGFAWTMRVSAFVNLVMLFITNIALKTPTDRKSAGLPTVSLVKPLADIHFWLSALGAFFFHVGYFTVLTFLVIVAFERGWSNAIMSLVAFNIASLFGRIIPSYLADRFGKMNMVLLTSFSSTVLTLGFWVLGSSLTTEILFSVFYGFTSGSIVALTPAVAIQNSPCDEERGLRVGLTYILLSFAALMGSPIGGRLITADNGDVKYLTSFCFALQLVGCVVFLTARVARAGLKLKVKI